MFTNRTQAGQLLAAKLEKYKSDNGIVLAVPRGGVPVAYEVARELGLPLELIFTKKIGHPMNREYAIGAASINDYFVIPHDDVNESYIEKELIKIRSKLKEMHSKYMGNKKDKPLKGKTVIVIDDGIATGNTLMATVNLLKRGEPGKIVIGVPVASQSAVKMLLREVDEVVAVNLPEVFRGVGVFYEDFEQVSDEEVMKYLDKIRLLNKA